MKIEISGVIQAQARLDALPKKVIGQAIREGGKMVGKEAVQDLLPAIPIDTGTLKRSIGSRILSRRAGELYAIKVGGTKKVARKGGKRQQQDYVLRFLEAGTKRHMLIAWDKNGKRLDRQQIRKMNTAGQRAPHYVMHSGIRGRGLLRQQVIQHENDYIQSFRLGFESVLQQYISTH